MRLLRISSIQKEFARKDYYHLSQAEAEALNKQRNELAKSLAEKRKLAKSDFASYNSAAGGNKSILEANKKALSENYKFYLNEAKSAAENLRNRAVESSTNTALGKETNTFATKPKTTSMPKNSKPGKPKIKMSAGMKKYGGLALAGTALIGTGAYLYNKGKKKD